MQRRDLLAISGLAVLTAGSAALGQSGSEARLRGRIIRIYATADGESRIEEIEIAENAGPAPLTQMTAGVYTGTGARAPVWHTAPRRQFSINMTGELEVEVTDGTRKRIGAGDLVFLDDVTGKGHITRALGPITNIFIHVPDTFDVVAWAKGA